MKNKSIILFFLFLFFITSFIVLFLFIHKQEYNKQIPRIFIQKPVDKIKLPYGLKMNQPFGFTVFESKANNILVYNFIKYVPEWKNNNFVKIDFSIINKKYMDISIEKFGQSNFDFDEAVIKPKINLSNELKKIREKSNQEGMVYDIDYSNFRPQYSINGKINNKVWRRYTLQAYELQGDNKTNLIKLWNNLYTTYKDYVFICDYVCYAGIKIKNNKQADLYSESANGIDKLAQEIISSIDFK